MLDLFSRGAILGLTTLCVAGALELAPVPARSFFDDVARRPPRPVGVPAADAVGMLPVRRDPFAEPAPLTPRNAPAAVATAPRETVGALPSNLIGDTIPTLPGAPPEAPTNAARITAIVAGAHPFAMVESGGDHEIKGVGDRVGGIPIVAIDIDGIRLQNGTRLGVDSAARQ